MLKMFNAMAISVPGIALTHEKLHSLYFCLQGVRYDSINILGPCQLFCSHESSVKLNLAIFLVLVRQQENEKNAFIFWLLTSKPVQYSFIKFKWLLRV